MSVISHTSEPSGDEPPVDASCSQLCLMVDEAVRQMEAAGILPDLKARLKKPVGLVPEVLMEFSAILTLTAWLEAGLCSSADASAAVSVTEESIRKLCVDPHAYRELAVLPPVTEQVMRIWQERFAWHAATEVRASIALGVCDEDAVLEALADFLWSHHTEAGMRGGSSDGTAEE